MAATHTYHNSDDSDHYDCWVGAYGTLKLQDEMTVEAAKFAVAEHNKHARKSLTFILIVEGLGQIVSGTNYKLAILAKDCAIYNYYAAYVYEGFHEESRELISFKQIFEAAYEPLENRDDAMIVEAAKFVVAEHNKQAKTSLKFVRADGKVHVDEAKLVIVAKDSPLYDCYEAFVNVNMSEDGTRIFRTLISFKQINFERA